MKAGLAIAAVALAVMIFSAEVRADRLWGSMNATYQYNRFRHDAFDINSPGGDTTVTTLDSRQSLGQSNLLFNYQDALFTKNTMRLAASVYARQIMEGKRWEIRPIYYFDLKSVGYSFNSSYSPYSQLSELRLPDNTRSTFRTYWRDWRNTALMSYEKWPSLSVVYNVTSSFDRLATKKTDTRSRNMIIESNYSRRSLSLRGNYSLLRSENKLPLVRTRNTIRSYTGAVSVSKDMVRVGYFSSTYSYLHNQTERRSLWSRYESNTGIHSITGIASSREYHHFAAMANYSGRFQAFSQTGQDIHSRSEIFSGQLSYVPKDWLNFGLVKAYQIDGTSNRYQITEYVTLSAGATHYLRNGVDSRFTWSRTFFQQAVRVADQPGSGRYTLDTYGSSIGASLYNYTRMLFDLSVTRTNDPALVQQR